jgi:hypothetical protein
MANQIEPIQPVNIPAGAGINYGEGDVRHFSQGDEVSVPGLSNTTRHLAERDNMLAEKLNEVIANVNNQEQFVPLPVIRTIVPPNDQTTVLNYRVPAGFESRVLNASVSASPASTDIELIIYYGAGFGDTTGTQVVNTSNEFSGGVNFYQSGEFIIVLKNKSGFTLEMVASILLTLRPIGAAGTLLVGSTIKGDKGDPGQAGPPGPQGIPGSGAVGAPGMHWSGSWTSGAVYSEKDVVRYDLDGPSIRISSFYCKANNVAGPTNAPDQTAINVPSKHATWDAVAVGGLVGPAGPTGPIGADGVVPKIEAVSAPVDVVFTKGVGFFSDGYQESSAIYPSLQAAASPSNVQVYETYYGSTATASVGSGIGMAYLNRTFTACFVGEATLKLPKKSLGARVDYTTDYIMVTVTNQGTEPAFTRDHGVYPMYAAGTTAMALVWRDPASLTDTYRVKVLGDRPMPVQISIYGGQVVTQV